MPLPNEGKRPLLAHLEELRWRFLRCFLWVGVGTAVGFYFAKDLLAWFIQPVGSVVFLSPIEPFLAYLKVALIAGTALASPFLSAEAWGFLQPALFPHERRGFVFLIPASVGLFFLGGWFCWRFLLPVGLKFLLGFSSENMVPMITIGSYLGFAGWLLVGCGLFFQMPVAILVLARAGIVRPATLLKQWRFAVLGIFVLAAVLTPTPDVATQMLLALPMGFLYLVSVGLAFLVVKK